MDRADLPFSTEPLFDRLRGGDPSAVPIFVVGMPRSGSTLVEQILSSHPKFDAAGELPNFPWPRPIFRPTSGIWHAAALRRIAPPIWSDCPPWPRGRRASSTKLPIFWRIGLIRLILPNAKIVHAMRDPIDTCASCYSKLFTWGVEYSYA